jgi:SprT protein
MTVEKIKLILDRHVPAVAVGYCLDLWHHYNFDFRLRNSRVTKIGDFTFRPGQVPRITVNRDLSHYLFLITYLHEVAHLEVHRQFGHRVEAHGREWKKIFIQILEPVLAESFFPEDVLQALRRHMIDPRATTFSDPELMHVLRRYDPRADALTFLADIPEGSVFGIRGRWFKKGITKRTRALCQEVKSKRKYFVPLDAPVENVQLSFL